MIRRRYVVRSYWGSDSSEYTERGRYRTRRVAERTAARMNALTFSMFRWIVERA